MKLIKSVCAISVAMCLSSAVFALSLADLSNKDVNSGLKAALEQGSAAAVSKLGVEGGFLNNDKVKIRLPDNFEKARTILAMAGQSKKLDELEVSMNRAAESAIPLAKPLLMNAIKSMTLTDAKNILSGGETSVTDFFKSKTGAPLAEKFLPIVKGVTDKAGLSKNFNSILGKASKFGVLPAEQSTVESYVSQKATDGLYLMIAEEEKAIRQDPVAAGSKIIGKVFGVLK